MPRDPHGDTIAKPIDWNCVSDGGGGPPPPPPGDDPGARPDESGPRIKQPVLVTPQGYKQDFAKIVNANPASLTTGSRPVSSAPAIQSQPGVIASSKPVIRPLQPDAMVQGNRRQSNASGCPVGRVVRSLEPEPVFVQFGLTESVAYSQEDLCFVPRSDLPANMTNLSGAEAAGVSCTTPTGPIWYKCGGLLWVSTWQFLIEMDNRLTRDMTGFYVQEIERRWKYKFCALPWIEGVIHYWEAFRCGLDGQMFGLRKPIYDEKTAAVTDAKNTDYSYDFGKGHTSARQNGYDVFKIGLHGGHDFKETEETSRKFRSCGWYEIRGKVYWVPKLATGDFEPGSVKEAGPLPATEKMPKGLDAADAGPWMERYAAVVWNCCPPHNYLDGLAYCRWKDASGTWQGQRHWLDAGEKGDKGVITPDHTVDENTQH